MTTTTTRPPIKRCDECRHMAADSVCAHPSLQKLSPPRLWKTWEQRGSNWLYDCGPEGYNWEPRDA